MVGLKVGGGFGLLLLRGWLLPHHTLQAAQHGLADARPVLTPAGSPANQQALSLLWHPSGQSCGGQAFPGTRAENDVLRAASSQRRSGSFWQLLGAIQGPRTSPLGAVSQGSSCLSPSWGALCCSPVLLP